MINRFTMKLNYLGNNSTTEGTNLLITDLIFRLLIFYQCCFPMAKYVSNSTETQTYKNVVLKRKQTRNSTKNTHNVIYLTRRYPIVLRD